MLRLSAADGFMNVKEGVDEMIKFLANEPSVGLYFVQKHTHASMPYLLDVRDKITEKVHEVTLHIEDVEDSISVVKSMKDFGCPLAEHMINDINKSLLIMSKSQPKKGLIQNPTWGDSSSSSTPPVADSYNFNSSHQKRGGNLGYLSAVLKSAKQRAVGFRSRPTDPASKAEQFVSTADPSIPSDVEAEELPVSSRLQLDENPIHPLDEDASQGSKMLHHLEDYDKFKREKAAKYEAWLQDSEEHFQFIKPGDL